MEDALDRLKKQARQDSDDERFLACRRLFVNGTKDEVLIALLGPYEWREEGDAPDDENFVYFTEIRHQDSRRFVPSPGDRFQAFCFAGDMARLQLAEMIKTFPQGLVESDGSPYLNYDFSDRWRSPF